MGGGKKHNMDRIITFLFNKLRDNNSRVEVPVPLCQDRSVYYDNSLDITYGTVSVYSPPADNIDKLELKTKC